MCYNGDNKGKQLCEYEQNLKNHLSSDCSLQLESMKLELLVIVDQHATVNMYTNLVHTARHTLEMGLILNCSANKISFLWINLRQVV
jgi:hypothetical protein